MYPVIKYIAMLRFHSIFNMLKYSSKNKICPGKILSRSSDVLSFVCWKHDKDSSGQAKTKDHITQYPIIKHLRYKLSKKGATEAGKIGWKIHLPSDSSRISFS